jgi:hypothetical protein
MKLKELNYGLIVALLASLCIWATIAILLCGCTWQGQRHHIADERKMVELTSEWWSMRLMWMSNGIECYTSTPYYTSGANIEESKTDPNAVEAVVEGVVEGLK